MKIQVVPAWPTYTAATASTGSLYPSVRYSFTGLTGQAIYPLNGVLIGLFLFWVLARILRHRHSLTGLVYFGLFTISAGPCW